MILKGRCLIHDIEILLGVFIGGVTFLVLLLHLVNCVGHLVVSLYFCWYHFINLAMVLFSVWWDLNS